MPKTKKSPPKLQPPSERQAPPKVDWNREAIETIVFVAILVLLLKTFGAEAYRIPSGSMAPTLLGAHYHCTCSQCGQEFDVGARTTPAGTPINEISETDHVFCPNCLNEMPAFPQYVSGALSGDYVLVSKYFYEGPFSPQRWNVVVFLWRSGGRPENFIKRLVGLPGDHLHVHYGDVFNKDSKTNDLQILRKPPEVMLSMRRLVYNNDLQAKGPNENKIPPRWQIDDPQSKTSWTRDDNAHQFSIAGGQGQLRYQHINRHLPADLIKPGLITDFAPYSLRTHDAPGMLPEPESQHYDWVGDLMVESDVQIQKMEGTVTAQLNEGKRTFETILNFKDKTMVLKESGKEIKNATLAISGPGTYSFRFANFDDRLTVWWNGNLVFGDGVDIPAPAIDQRGPYPADMSKPVTFTADGAHVTLSHVKLYRDQYYALRSQYSDFAGLQTNNQWSQRPERDPESYLYDPDRLHIWRKELQLTQPTTFKLGPDDFVMLGDNSISSSDSREWGDQNPPQPRVVKRRLLLGRALAVYFPINRWRFVK